MAFGSNNVVEARKMEFRCIHLEGDSMIVVQVAARRISRDLD